MKHRILVVDDDDNMIKLLGLVLKKDYMVDTAQNLNDAHAKLQDMQYDLLLVDLKLGGDSGYDLITHIREELDLKWVPLLILSGMAKSEDRIKCFELGADDYMIKPFNPEELKYRIQRHIKKYQVIKEAIS